MRSNRVLSTIDFHTAGIGMRLLTSGLGPLPGSTIGEKRRGFQERLDHLRTGLCLEPRGHRGLLIAVMTEPVTPGAQFGLFFIYPGGYYVSCGEGTIGAATVAIETGMVERRGTETPVVIDTEAGAVETIVTRCFPNSTRAQVYECLAYYEDHRGDIDVLVSRQMSAGTP